MSTATADKVPVAKPPRIPPEEQFWKHYSPHGEAPLSLAGSFALHALGAGGMLLFAVYLAAIFSPATVSLPVEPIQIGGGGGKKTGVANGKGPGNGAEAVNTGDNDIEQTGLDDAPPRPALNPIEMKKVQEKYDPADVRIITETESGKAFARLGDKVQKLADGLQQASKGKGGTGSGGGEGAGKGTGTGDASGPGKATLNQRTKRMLRWHMRFSANSGPEYLAQLRGLGAILAFPVNEGAGEGSYKTIHNLVPGGRLQDEDVTKLNRIFWIDDKPKSVMDILRALGLQMQPLPSRFIAFMPEKLEKKLFDLESRYVKHRYGRFDEDRIDQTTFAVIRKPTGYDVELIEVTMK